MFPLDFFKNKFPSELIILIFLIFLIFFFVLSLASHPTRRAELIILIFFLLSLASHPTRRVELIILIFFFFMNYFTVHFSFIVVLIIVIVVIVVLIIVVVVVVFFFFFFFLLLLFLLGESKPHLFLEEKSFSFNIHVRLDSPIERVCEQIGFLEKKI